jgi:O-antigen/teichoic acid export membrane protein
VFVALLVAARIYDPLDFGAFAVFSAIVSLFAVVMTLRLDLAIPIVPTEHGAIGLVTLCVAVVSGMTAVACLVVAFSEGSLAAALELQDDYLVWLVPIALGAAGLYQALNSWAVRERRFDLVSRALTRQGIGQAGSMVGIGLAVDGPAGLLIGGAVGRMGGIVAIGRPLVHGARDLAWRRTDAPWRQLLTRYRRFPLLSAPAALINSAGANAAPLLLAALYGPKTAGVFGLAVRLVGGPLTLFGDAVAQAYVGEAAKGHRDDDGTMRALLDATAKRLLLLGALPLAFLALAGPRLFSVLLGPEWEEAGEFVRVLSPMLLMQFVAVPISGSIFLVERQAEGLAWDVARLVVVVSTLVFAERAGWSADDALLLFSFGVAVMYGVLLALARHSVTHPRRVDPDQAVER